MSGEIGPVGADRLPYEIRAGLLYTEQGVWLARDPATGIVRLGLSDARQCADGPATFVELPEPGMSLATGEECADVETPAANVSVPAPFSGTVLAVNGCLASAPELINLEPYGKGWLVEIKPDRWPITGCQLLSAPAYSELVCSGGPIKPAGPPAPSPRGAHPSP